MTKLAMQKFETDLNQLFDINTDALFKTDQALQLSVWQGIEPSELPERFESLKNALLALKDRKDVFEKLPKNVADAAAALPNRLKAPLQQFIATQNQTTFQNLMNIVESSRTSLFTWNLLDGLVVEANIGVAGDEVVKATSSLQTSIAEVDVLKNSVQALVDPAIAGSLSESFTKRSKRISKYSFVWASLAVIGTVVALFLADSILDTLTTYQSSSLEISSEQNSENASAESTTSSPNLKFETLSILEIIVLRSLILIPVLGFIFYAFKRFGRERELEEEYAHKSSISTVLPNYSELATDLQEKDRIVGLAAEVIFKLPGKKEKQVSGSRFKTTDVSRLVDEVSKLVSKSD